MIRPQRQHLPEGRAGTAAAGLLLVSVAALTGTTLTAGVIMAVPDVQRGAAAPGTVLVDYAVSAGAAAAAVALLRNPRTWATHLLGVGLFAAAAGFNTHAIGAAVRVAEVLVSPLAGLLRVLLPAVAATLVLLAVVAELAPAAATARPLRKPAGRGVFAALALVAAVAAAAVLPPAAVGVLFLGTLTPTAGLVCLLGSMRRPSLAAARARSRPLLALLTGSMVVLAALPTTAALSWLVTPPGPHRTIVTIAKAAGADAAGAAGPLTLPLWTAQLTVIALAGVMLAQSRGGAARIERRVTRAAAVAVVAAVSTAGFLLVDQAAALITDARPPSRVLAASVAAAMPVALAFLPLYTATIAALDRVLYGTRPTPYRVLAGITTASRADPVDAPDLDRLVEDVATGLGATRCRLTVRRPGLPDRVHRWPPAIAGGSSAGGSDHPNGPDPAVEVDIRHGGEIVGSLAVDDTALGGPQPQRRRELLTDVADSLGVVLQASRAGVALEQQLRAAVTYATDIAAARRTLVAAMDRERRRIERDLHDGVQHHLTCLRVTLGLVDHQIATAQLGPARSRLDQLVEGLDITEAVLAETAQGVSAPLLAELGLVQALRTGIDGGDPPLEIDAAPDLDDRLVPRPIAAAVYYCCLEAVGNARKHSPSAAIAVHLRPDGDWLRVSVVDDGIGFDTTSKPHPEGRGLRNVAARVGSVGGHVAISSTPGYGTTVETSVPLPRLAASRPDDLPPHSEQTAPHPARVELAARAGAPPASLAARVREALRTAREYYHRTPYAPWLRTLAERLDGPPHIAVIAGATHTKPPACADQLTDRTAPAYPPDVALAAALRHRHPALTFIALSTAPSEQPGVRDPTAGTAAVLEVTTEPQRGRDGVATSDHTSPLRGPRTADSPDRASTTQGPRGQAGSTLGTTNGTTIVVLGHPPTTATLPDEATRDDQSVRTTVPAVVPVDVHMAAAAQNLTPAQYDRLRQLAQHHPGPSPADAPQPRGAGAPRAPHGETPPANSDAVDGQDHIDRAAPQAALALIRSKRPADHTALADQLTTLSGLNRLSALLEARAAGCGDAPAARSVLVELEQLVRVQPPAQGADQLCWQLERIRATSHELAELDLIEQLRGGRLPVPQADRGVALRLLGADGADPRTRLALAADADLDQLRAAAEQQRDRWQQLAAHPATTRALRTLAETVTHTCTQLHSGQYRHHRHPDTPRHPLLSSDRLWSPDGDRSTAAR